MRTRILWRLLAATVLVGFGAGCLDTGDSGNGAGTGSDGGADSPGDGDRDGASSDLATGEGPACLVSGSTSQLAVSNVDKVDLLFVIDNSGSMRDAQEALRREFPRLVEVLATGDIDLDGVADFPPARDLPLGVVSSDMGLVGIQGIPLCAGLGDDGIMNNVPDPTLTGCQASYPRFITFTAGVNDPTQTANDFACIASLGTEGCGFEQQLEAGLKALWPSVDIDPESGEVIQPNRIQFLGDVNGFGQVGHGDQENAGFLRNDVVQGRSVIAIVMVSDEEDCSSADTRHFTPDLFLDPADPLAMQDLNLRCFFNPQNLYNLDRYVNGFQALRPGQENLVIFAGIVGVPPDLVDESARANVDLRDEAARNAYYDNMLADPRMQEVPDRNRTPEQGGNLIPSCITETVHAFPARRFVEVARRFGENGVIQSICQNDFGPAMQVIVEAIARQLGAECLPRSLERADDGLVGCNVVWELPPPNLAPANTPTTCGQGGWDFLLPPDEGREAVSDRGGQICKVQQLAVMDGQFQTTDGFGAGWFYDDFSEDVQQECTGPSKQRIAFTPEATPPTGVTVKLECATGAETPVENAGFPADQPRFGDACRSDADCEREAQDGAVDDTLICLPDPRGDFCVPSCDSEADCPGAAWACEDWPEEGRLCVPRPASVPTSEAAACDGASGNGGRVSNVGRACLPEAVPDTGFRDDQVYLQTRSPLCGDGICMVYRLRGDPRETCVDSCPDASSCDSSMLCADPRQIEDRVYCTCRCDGPGGADTCACPDGFSCVQALEIGPPELRGGYC
ncbi:MAG: hypothetical protein OXT09_27580, partial [Myxococcales bacterium]|nr:hypothetical protein [Myxococcales bacterium]